MSLRSDLKKLASQHPELRPHLVPLLRGKTAGRNGEAKIQWITGGFKLTFALLRSPEGYTTDNISKMDSKIEQSIDDLVNTMAEAADASLTVSRMGRVTLIYTRGNDLMFIKEATVKTKLPPGMELSDEGEFDQDMLEDIMPMIHRMGFTIV